MGSLNHPPEQPPTGGHVLFIHFKIFNYANAFVNPVPLVPPRLRMTWMMPDVLWLCVFFMPPLVRDVNTRPGPGAVLYSDFTVPQDVFKQRSITAYGCDRSGIM